MVGGLIYDLEGSWAPSGPFTGGPPCMPGSPRPALVTGAELTPGLGANWGVVEGVMTLAGSPLVGAEDG
jgi:hypothetical protein